MLLKTEGIVLRTIKYRETSVISDIFTSDKGLISILANGVRKQKSRLSASLFQAASLVEVVIYYKENANLHRLKEIRSSTPLFSISENIKKIAIAQFITELSRKTVAHQNPSPQFFYYVKNHLINLENAEKPDSLIPLKFLLGLCPFLGITPDFGRFKGGFFDMREGITVREKPDHPHFLDQEKTDLLTKIYSLEKIGKLDLPTSLTLRRELFKTMLNYYKIHLDGMKDLKSPDILRSILEK